MSAKRAAPPARTRDGIGARAGAYLRQAFAVAAAEVQKLRHDPFELFTRAVQPVLWLVLCGEVMAQICGLPSGNLNYLDFLAAGILSQSVLFVGVGQVVTMPIFFASNAIYRLEIMRRWLRLVARANPLTYEVDGLWALMIRDGTRVFGLALDYAVLALVFHDPGGDRGPAGAAHRKGDDPARPGHLSADPAHGVEQPGSRQQGHATQGCPPLSGIDFDQ